MSFAAQAGVVALLALHTPTPWAQAQPNDPVIVTATRLPQPLSATLADVSVIDRRDIDRSGASSVAELLARLPGVEIATNGGPGTTTGVFVRGTDTRHTAVFIDGVRVDSQSVGGAVWEQIPIEQIDRIEVLRGPAAAVYGSDAVGGVVQLFTRRARSGGGARPSASIGLASYGTRRIQAGVDGAQEGWDYALSASHGRSKGFSARTTPADNPDRDGWRRNAASLRAGWQPSPTQRVDASVLTTRLNAQFDQGDQDDTSRHALRTASLNWQGRWSETAATSAQFAESNSTYESQPFFYRTETTLRHLLVQHEQRIAAQQRVSLIAERREDRLLNPATEFSPTLQGKRSQNGAALGWHADAGNHGVQAHVRRDSDSEFGGQTTASLAWGWRFAAPWRFSLAAASSFRAPTLYQRFSEFGVATLVPESGRNVEAGLRWQPRVGQQVSLNAWRNTVSDLLDFGAAGPCASTFGCYVNVGRARYQGVTLAGQAAMGNVNLRGSLGLQDPRNLDTGKTLARRARKLATLGADTTAVGWTLGAELQAAGLRYDDGANTVPLERYVLVNLSASRAFASGWSIEGRIDNAADERYELARSYATPGRTLQVALRWTMP